ncbi:extensin family protein [Roseateles sp. DC23W]|uniref:Extensin family protein n=1 Tax=Pelomonas dachongensis TaxID=3299029 RepID=A0ABW7EM75_9BURK
MKRIALTLLAVVAMAGAVGALGWQQAGWRLPDRHNPFAPLQVDTAPNWLTSFKLARAQRDSARCAAVASGLDRLGWRASPVPDRRTGEGCGFANAWRIETIGAVQVGDAFTLSCPSLLALAMWQHHAVEPAALRHFGQPMRRLQHVGSYACRNLYGRESTPRSRHATADALDVTGFVLASGRRIAVQRDWGAKDAAASAFLHEVHEGACRWFDGTLGPDYNAAHRDHFHLETGGWRTCR